MNEIYRWCGNSIEEWPESRSLPYYFEMQPKEQCSNQLIARIRSKKSNIPMDETTLDLLTRLLTLNPDHRISAE